MKKYTSELKESIVNRYLNGESVAKIVKNTDLSRSTIYTWIAQQHKNSHNDTSISVRGYKRLEQKCARQEKIILILKQSPCTVSAPLKEKLQAIENMVSDELNVNILCEALGVSKGTYYNRILRGKLGNTQYDHKRNEIKPIIEQIFNDSNQIYGAGKVTAVMKERGYSVAETTVARIMHENGMFSIRTGAKNLYKKNQERKENILKQNFQVSRPNEVWVSDVTYYKLHNMTFYICVIIDLFARKVVGYRISNKNSTQLTTGTFKEAFLCREPKEALLFHSDRGSNYVAKTFSAYLRKLGIQQSFSRGGMPYDNSVCESFFSNLKREELYRRDYKSINEMKKSIGNYMDFYNKKRPHSIIRYQTPDKYEIQFYAKNKGLSIK